MAPGRPGPSDVSSPTGSFSPADRKAKFLFTDVVPLPEIPDESYPFFLLTGRGTMHQWHTQTRTGKVEMMKKMYPADSYAEVSPVDAERMGIVTGTDLKVTSRRGTVRVKAIVKDSVRPGFVFLPMHYPRSELPHLSGVRSAQPPARVQVRRGQSRGRFLRRFPARWAPRRWGMAEVPVGTADHAAAPPKRVPGPAERHEGMTENPGGTVEGRPAAVPPG